MELAAFIISCASTVISFTTSMVILWNARNFLKYQRYNYTSNILKDYYFIIYELKQKAISGSISAETYYRTYWSHLLREYDAWTDGIVDDELYIRWLRQEKIQYRNNNKLKNLTYQEAYKNLIHPEYSEITDSDLFTLMNKIFENNNSPKYIEAVLREHKEKIKSNPNTLRKTRK